MILSCIFLMNCIQYMLKLPPKPHPTTILMFLTKIYCKLVLLPVFQVMYTTNLLVGVYLNIIIGKYGTQIILILAHNDDNLELMVGVRFIDDIRISGKVYLLRFIGKSGTWSTVEGCNYTINGKYRTYIRAYCNLYNFIGETLVSNLGVAIPFSL